MAKRDEDLSAYAEKQLIIAFAPLGRQSDSDYRSVLINGNTMTGIDVSYYIGMGIFKPYGENARIIGYLDGDVIKILGNCMLKNYTSNIEYKLASIGCSTIPLYSVERYPDEPDSRKDGIAYAYMNHNTVSTSGTLWHNDIGLDFEHIVFPDPDDFHGVTTKASSIPQNPKFKLGENNGGYSNQRLNIDPDHAVITVPATFDGKWITAQSTLGKWNESVIPKEEYDLRYTPSDNFQNILKTAYDYYHDDVSRYFKIDSTNRQSSAYLGSYKSDVWGDHQWNAEQVNMMPVRVYNLLVTKNLDQAKKYVADGTLPDDVYVTKPYPGDIGQTPTDSPDENGEDGNLKDDVDRIPTDEPDATTVTLSNTHYYRLSKEDLKDFFIDLWSLDFSDLIFNQVTGVYTNLIENVVSLRWFPVMLQALGEIGTTEGIKLGYTTLETAGTTIASVAEIMLGGMFDIKPVYNSYMDYAPYTEIQVFLPFYGMLDLDVNLFMDHKLVVHFTVDIASGLITYYILRDDTIVQQVQAKCGIDIPITLSSMIDVASQISNNVVSKSVSLASATASGSPIGMVGAVLGNTASPKMHYLSGVGDNGALYGNRRVTLFIKHPQYNRPANYGKMVGYPTYGKFSLSKLTGFVVIENPKIDMTEKMELSEYNEIISLMQGGIYL